MTKKSRWFWIVQQGHDLLVQRRPWKPLPSDTLGTRGRWEYAFYRPVRGLEVGAEPKLVRLVRSQRGSILVKREPMPVCLYCFGVRTSKYWFYFPNDLIPNRCMEATEHVIGQLPDGLYRLEEWK